MNKPSSREFGTQSKFLNLPDTSYWLSREEIILTYLFQRNAPVPQVLRKDSVTNSLTLGHAGKSADHLSSEVLSSDEADISALKILQQSINALIKINNLGVQHLDVALRNLATQDFYNVEVRLLDFTHALSENHNLQKPLPLVPVPGLHHPRLIAALVADWNDYFSKIGKTCPELNESLSISNDEFTSYWTDTTHVQKLCKDMGILGHSIGNLTLEIATTVISDRRISNELTKAATQMKCLTHEAGVNAINELLLAISELMPSLTYSSFNYSNATPIPLVKNSQSSDPSFEKIDKPRVNLTANAVKESGSRLEWRKSKAFELLLWFVAFFNLFLIDHIVTSNAYILSNFALYTCITALLLCPTLLALGFAFRSKFGRFLRCISLCLLVAAQLETLVDCVSISTNTLSAWISTPLLLIASIFLL